MPERLTFGTSVQALRRIEGTKVMVLARAVDVRDKWDGKRRLVRNDVMVLARAVDVRDPAPEAV